MTMKKTALLISIVIFAILSFLAFAPEDDLKKDELEIGAKAPLTDLEVKDVSGEMLTLNDVAGENGLLVIFSCNTCPWVSKWEGRYNPIANLAEENGIGTIALNPNSAYRDRGDGFKDMQKRARESGYEFYYALDKDSRLAEVFGATRTPHIFLFDADMELVYRGAIDDNANSADAVEKPYLKNAIKELASGKQVSTQTSKSLGCTIKWAE